MASTVTVAASITVNDGVKNTVVESISNSIATALSNNGKRESVSCTGSAFTALSPPTLAKGALIRVEGVAIALTLKGITGDTGIPITTTAAGSIPLLIPLGTSPSIGIANAGATQVIEIIWF